MPIFIPTGGDFGGLADFGGGLMQGIAMHRERQRQEQMAIDAQKRAQQFALEMDAQRNATHDRRTADDRAWQEMRDNMRFSREQAAKAGEEAQKQAELAARAGDLQAMYEGVGGLPTERQMPDGVAGPGLRTPALRNPADVHAAASVYGQNLNRQATQAEREADNARADAALAGTQQYRADSLAQRGEYQQSQLDIAQKRLELAMQKVASEGQDLTPEEHAQRVADYVAMQDERAPMQDRLAAFERLRTKKQVGVDALPKRTPADKTARARDAWAEIQALRAQIRSTAANYPSKVPELQKELDAKREAYFRQYGNEAPPETAPGKSNVYEDLKNELLDAGGP